MKRGFALVLILSLLLASPAAAFSDVPGWAWYAPAVSYAQEKGFMNGVGDERFDPDGVVSRGMLAAVLYRMAGEPPCVAPLEFRDIKAGQWFADDVIWCADMGIVTGVDATHFAPNDPVTREQAALMLWRFAGWPQGSPTAIFWDGGQIHEWSRLGVDWAYQAGVVTGKDDGSFDPQGYATRAQIAQMLMKFDRWRSS